MQIVEGSSDGKLVVEGKIGHVDRPTANNRVYPRGIMEREINRLSPRIEAGSVLGAVDHPGDGKSRIRDAGCIVRNLWVEGTGEIMGRFEVVEETRAGSDLAAFLRRGAAIGMSSRGIGSTSSGSNGWDMVGEDFRLNTWDFVADPACHDAYPGVISEDVDAEGNPTGKIIIDPEKITEFELREKFPELVRGIEEHAYQVANETISEETEGEDVRTALKLELQEEVRKELEEDFAVKLVRALAEMRKDVREEVQSEIDSDPENASAKIALKKVAEMVSPFKPTDDVKRVLGEKDAEIDELQKTLSAQSEADQDKDERISALEDKGRELAYQVFIERNLSGREDSDELREQVGPIEEIESPQALKLTVENILANAKKRETQVAEQVEVVRQQMQEQVDRAEAMAMRAQEAEAKLRESVQKQIDSLAVKLQEVVAERDEQLAERDERLATQARELEEAVTSAEKASLYAYASNRTIGHAKRKALLEAVQDGSLRDKDAVDKATTMHEDSAPVPGGVHERVRAAMSRGREHLSEEEAELFGLTEERFEDDGEAAEDLAAIGTDLYEQTELAGISRPTRR
jgi:hypothetical protein